MNKSLKMNELADMLDLMWASTEDIQKIGCIGKNEATKIKRKIRNQMVDDEMVFPRYRVSMEYVIKYFKIDEKKVRKLAMNGGVENAR